MEERYLNAWHETSWILLKNPQAMLRISFYIGNSNNNCPTGQNPQIPCWSLYFGPPTNRSIPIKQSETKKQNAPNARIQTNPPCDQQNETVVHRLIPTKKQQSAQSTASNNVIPFFFFARLINTKYAVTTNTTAKVKPVLKYV